jgi:hypothetical protein
MLINLIKSYLLTPSEFAELQDGASVIELDHRGAKVLLLPDGNMLKIFRLRGILTSSRIYSNARSFCRNAARLKTLGIPTVNIIRLYHFQSTTDTAVLYQPLAGTTIKDLLKQHAITDDICQSLGELFARMHRLGIHFKSLHFGNIVLSLSGELGLIDIADMRIYPWRLWLNTRLRGFRRLLRYQDDMHLLGRPRWGKFLNAYFSYSELSPHQERSARKTLEKLYSANL